jgi:hypothetical protein
MHVVGAEKNLVRYQCVCESPMFSIPPEITNRGSRPAQISACGAGQVGNLPHGFHNDSEIRGDLRRSETRPPDLGWNI